MKRSHHNTTNESGWLLAKFEGKAKSQEIKILSWFKAQPRLDFTSSPTEVLRSVFNNGLPITSVRRAITNLTTNGDLFKTDKKVNGPYGRPECLWRLANKHHQKQRELF